MLIGLLLGAALAWLWSAWRHEGVVRALRRSSIDLTREQRDRLRAVVAQRNELEAVLGSMVEGVMALDAQGRLLSVNTAGASLLRIERALALGRPIQEVVRNSDLQRLVEDTIAQGESLHEDLSLKLGGVEGTQRWIEAQTAVLNDGDGQRIGVVVVLHDVTQLRKLESVRRDFVANVSHEVKTPVSAIKAAIETLLDDADGSMPAEDRERFSRMIARQADRLDAIVEDLLSLARIEQGQEQVQVTMQPARVLTVLEAARETVSAKASGKAMSVEIDCDPALESPMVPALVEQAVVNLLDNAIKYSPEGTSVRVVSRLEGGELVIAVSDRGRGIEAEHLPRVFERFYRTDRARSRALGGTGLGLSIVRHIAQAHGGRALAESVVGRGSTFTLCLPAATGRAGFGEDPRHARPAA